MFVKIGMSYWLNAIHFYNDDSSNVLNIWITSYKVTRDIRSTVHGYYIIKLDHKWFLILFVPLCGYFR